MQRIVEEEQRRAQVDPILHAFILTIRQFVGGNIMIDEAERQGGSVAARGRTHRSTGETTTSGMTSRVPCRIAVQAQQVGMPPLPAAGNMNTQANSIAAILQAARRGDVAGQLEDDDHARNGPDNGDKKMATTIVKDVNSLKGSGNLLTMINMIQMTTAGLKDCGHGRSRLANT
jgi:hypothetical protein